MKSLTGALPAAQGSSQESGLARLFVEHNRDLVRFLQTRLESRQEAEEVAQESYARLLGLDQPDVLGFLRAYLFKTAAHLAIDRLRHRATRRSAVPRLEASYGLNEASTPEEIAASEQEASLVSGYLAELPASCQRAFVLYRVQELSLAEVAAEMRVSERMVRYYIVRAMSHCRARLIAARVTEGSK